ncbi:MAG: Hepatitis C virus core protein [Synechococcus sp. TMED155]|jgi:hypothetical protein|nr:MAG: Hepatitis C virus core protein [Synechococcus sp. TMED155]|tara:strand:- start:343 stop:738 length:396 start_codon:yes stop_codon:yes gene_type:complete
MTRSPVDSRDRGLAAAGLVANVVWLILASLALRQPDPLQTANLVLALAAWIPTAVVGLIASLALLLRRRWGMVLALVALGLQILVLIPYGIVRVCLVSDARGLTASLTTAVLVIVILLIVHWGRALARPRP